ncbi:hypothetical protein AwDysgo_21630 [Bacteroidales bacterium]|nr:hypothetical protein AwDysgo_21630 [Bacteroidales bacterium]
MKPKKILFIVIVNICTFISCNKSEFILEVSPYDLEFIDLADNWDQAMPLGNGMVGTLIWQKEDMLRMSLDYVKLWDERKMVNYDSLPVRNFKWVEEQVLKNDYKPVQMMYDIPYETSAYPTKIPGAALEFDIKNLGEIKSVRLYLKNAVNIVTWHNNSKMYSFVHPSENIGWFKFDNVDEDFSPSLVPPAYNKSGGISSDIVEGLDLRRLGYIQGEVIDKDQTMIYTQQGAEGFVYQVAVKYKKTKTGIVGAWSISTNKDDMSAEENADLALNRGYNKDLEVHKRWWEQYWNKSSIDIPDTVLAKQYYNELYKFGSAARSYSPPVSLQAVWTADNGKLPPWKGDYHHDLNTQLSYWHAYTANRLDEGMGYINWLLKIKEVNKKYTKAYFGSDGLAVPGVTSLDGEPMAGWIQYAFSPTISAWLSQHMYLQWQYSQDDEFLRDKAYPYIQEVLIFLDQLSVKDKDGKRTLPISSSPEIFNNSQKAWFNTITNYDLSLIRFAHIAAIDMAVAQGLNADAERYQMALSEWPSLDLHKDSSLTFAKNVPYEESHRHLSNMMAIHPLGLIDVSQGEESKKIIEASIQRIDSVGPSQWTGYSYSWLANLKARALDGEGAAEALRIFANHFCLRNTFHANGDQTNMGYSSLLYSPFTLEGNFAFAAGVQEMLIQSHTGIISVFPAIPASWQNVSFKQLRTVGAFLISAEMKNGSVIEIVIKAEKKGMLRLKNPFSNYTSNGKNIYKEENGVLYIETNEGEEVRLNVKQ